MPIFSSSGRAVVAARERVVAFALIASLYGIAGLLALAVLWRAWPPARESWVDATLLGAAGLAATLLLGEPSVANWYSNNLPAVGGILDAEHRVGFVEVIRRNAARLEALVSDLLSLAELERPGVAPRLEPVALRELAHAQVAVFRAVAESSGLSLELEPGPGLGHGARGVATVAVKIGEHEVSRAHSRLGLEQCLEACRGLVAVTGLAGRLGRGEGGVAAGPGTGDDGALGPTRPHPQHQGSLRQHHADRRGRRAD